MGFFSIYIYLDLIKIRNDENEMRMGMMQWKYEKYGNDFVRG